MKTQFLSVLALVAPFVFANNISPRTDLSLVGKPINAPEVLGSVALFLEAVDSVPYDVLNAGEEAADDWLVAHGLRQPGGVTARSTDVAISQVEERAVAATAGLLDIIACALAVGELILTTAIPVTKLLAVKKAIDALGGIRKAAELLLKSKDAQDALKRGGEALKEIFEALLGFKDVKKACT
ncbi:hypothetical protein B0T14DRAFT_497676 [Immersiella caudata]|uniref:Cell wall galactomannoprotein n=1 Tax=Immersiella caudata TaxID=314043 RepID=A0AA40BWQ9_9PEZI|nr:hypothetical protein B0T14DRAFT_497676 [Immersiella caudata]